MFRNHSNSWSREKTEQEKLLIESFRKHLKQNKPFIIFAKFRKGSSKKKNPFPTSLYINSSTEASKMTDYMDFITKNPDEDFKYFILVAEGIQLTDRWSVYFRFHYHKNVMVLISELIGKDNEGRYEPRPIENYSVRSLISQAFVHINSGKRFGSYCVGPKTHLVTFKTAINLQNQDFSNPAWIEEANSMLKTMITTSIASWNRDLPYIALMLNEDELMVMYSKPYQLSIIKPSLEQVLEIFLKDGNFNKFPFDLQDSQEKPLQNIRKVNLENCDLCSNSTIPPNLIKAGIHLPIPSQEKDEQTVMNEVTEYLRTINPSESPSKLECLEVFKTSEYVHITLKWSVGKEPKEINQPNQEEEFYIRLLTIRHVYDRIRLRSEIAAM
eukprot:TRINITY_DN4533_c0_g1_i8.p1 TRINITY_DN4533_c0_g1~~TRINITY_DN4533_c0_g1_i8.p1  ORF type:complete len:384 (+),score=28.30 TRINITY_DN4533_c0_g1_i8:51-1202(+)